MRQDVKDLADSMERGWKLAPKNCFWYFSGSRNTGRPTTRIPLEQVVAACAMGHALLGKGTTNIGEISKLFPILDTQGVLDAEFPTEDCMNWSLSEAINDLLLYENWSTPQVVAWLRTHEQD